MSLLDVPMYYLLNSKWYFFLDAKKTCYSYCSNFSKSSKAVSERVKIVNWQTFNKRIFTDVFIMQFNPVRFLSQTYLIFDDISITVGKKRVERLKPLAMRLPEIEISELSTRFIFRRFDAVEKTNIEMKQFLE